MIPLFSASLRRNRYLPIFLATSVLLAASLSAAEQRVSSPDDKLSLIVSDDAGLRYRVELDGKPLLSNSVLGLAFADGTDATKPETVVETSRDLGKAHTLTLRLPSGGGGYAAVISPK